MVVELANIEIQRLGQRGACWDLRHLGSTRQGVAGAMHGFSHCMRSMARATVAKVGGDGGQVRSRFRTVDFCELRVEARALLLGLTRRRYDNGLGQQLWQNLGQNVGQYLWQYLGQGCWCRRSCAFSSGYFLSCQRERDGRDDSRSTLRTRRTCREQERFRDAGEVTTLRQRHRARCHPARCSGQLPTVCQLRDQARQLRHRIGHHLHNLCAAWQRPVNHSIEQRLDGPGEFTDCARTDHPAAAFQGMEGATDPHQCFQLRGVICPARERGLDGRHFLTSFLNKEFDEIGIDMGIELRCRGQHFLCGEHGGRHCRTPAGHCRRRDFESRYLRSGFSTDRRCQVDHRGLVVR